MSSLNNMEQDNTQQPPDLETVRASFRLPAPEYGPIPFYWWVGEPLNRERIAWQLDQLRAGGVMSAIISYSHRADGSADRGEPPVFSPQWWELLRWVLNACRERGMTLGFQDYSVAPEVFREIGRDTPDMEGGSLVETSLRVTGPQRVQLESPIAEGNARFIAAFACPVGEGGIDLEQAIDLGVAASDGLHCEVGPGEWQITRIDARLMPFDAMHPQSGALAIERLYEVFARECPEHIGTTLNVFFQDELDFFGRMPLWSNRLWEEFKNRKGYDLRPYLPALWHECGPRTPKIRLDFGDVVTQLLEENFFIPVFAWNEAHGTLLGHDNIGRGDIKHGSEVYGDYFRTMRWYSAPGADDPYLQYSRSFKGSKLNSSIAHLYNRPRVWCEGFHSSGWGATPAQMIAALNQQYVYGASLFNPHALYYSTFGSWWEWAPPDFYFRQPYWIHCAAFTNYVRRFSYLMSAGRHRCDVALVYPLPTLEADPSDRETEGQIWALAKSLFDAGIDFDFVDHESFARARVADSHIVIGESSYAVMLFAHMKAARLSTLHKAQEFYEGGGLVLAYGALPLTTETGRNDPAAVALWNAMLGDIRSLQPQITARNASGGRCLYWREGQAENGHAEVEHQIAAHAGRDFETLGTQKLQSLHRQIGESHLYLVFNPHPEAVRSDVSFRSVGEAEIWDAWSGTMRPTETFPSDGTRIAVHLLPGEAILVNIVPRSLLLNATGIDKTDAPVEEFAFSLDGLWEFELSPTMDNRYGDFRLPATPNRLGAEVRRFRYRESTNANDNFSTLELDDSAWPQVTSSFGPRLWKLGPLPPSTDTGELEAFLRDSVIDPSQPVTVDGRGYVWEAYDFSLRWGIENDPFLLHALSGPHGLKKQVPDEFLDLHCEEPGSFWYLWTCVDSDINQRIPAVIGSRAAYKAWLRGEELSSQDVALAPGMHPVWNLPHYNCEPQSKVVELHTGSNPLLLRLTQPEGQRTRAFIAFDPPAEETSVPALRWFTQPSTWRFNAFGTGQSRMGWYRFDVPSGLAAFEVAVRGRMRAFIGGDETVAQQLAFERGVFKYRVELPTPLLSRTTIALRVELEPGSSAGDALPEPVQLECASGNAELGDWADLNLPVYSGAAWYRRTINVADLNPAWRVHLEMGDVAATARVRCNGHEVGTLLTPPWSLDITEFLHSGENRLEIEVANTLANHYSVGIPTPYVLPGQTRSGLFGPVRLVFHQ